MKLDIFIEKLNEIKRNIKSEYPKSDGWKFIFYRIGTLCLIIKIIQAPIDLAPYKTSSGYYFSKYSGKLNPLVRNIYELHIR
jgi:hypothetical protein